MFYAVIADTELEIQPRFFGPRLREEIARRLRQEVEGTCNGTNGFILAVTRVLKTERGIIREGVGSAVFTVKYQCITFMPNKDEVMDVVVKSVNKMGFFAEAGPLQVFVSNHLIPEDFEFDTSHDPAYVTGDGEQKIVPNCEVRLRIVGTRVDNAEIFAVGTIRDDYLGVISAPV